MTARRGRMAPSILFYRLVAGEVEVAAVGRIGGLARRKRGIELDAVAFEPLEHRDALFAERAQGRRRNRIADLPAQILVHRLGRVVVPGGLLIARASAGIIHAAALRACASALEPIGGNGLRARPRRLDR